MVNKVVWQPEFYSGYDFKVNLDWDFAREMIRARVSPDLQTRMNKLANEFLKDIGSNWLNPYSFHGNSCFINQIYLGQNGLWLSTNHRNIEDLLNENSSPKPIEYHSHNVDTPRQTFSLLKMFHLWVEYSDILKEKTS